MRFAVYAAFVPMILGAAGCAVSQGAKPAPASNDKGIAVVELFTSEGCSSCPPADAVLRKLAAEATKSGRPIYALSFHVDYWDRLGWADPFGKAEFTTRQQNYARGQKRDGTYTPQMIVNGTDEFVGSDAKEADRAIEAALSRPVVAAVELTAVAEGKAVTVEYAVADAPVGAVLCVAWVDAEAESRPNRGENGGAKLLHVNVVRDFRSIPLKDAAKRKLTLNRPDVKAGSIIAYVQEADRGRIVGAAATDVGR